MMDWKLKLSMVSFFLFIFSFLIGVILCATRILPFTISTFIMVGGLVGALGTYWGVGVRIKILEKMLNEPQKMLAQIKEDKQDG